MREPDVKQVQNDINLYAWCHRWIIENKDYVARDAWDEKFMKEYRRNKSIMDAARYANEHSGCVVPLDDAGGDYI